MKIRLTLLAVLTCTLASVAVAADWGSGPAISQGHGWLSMDARACASKAVTTMKGMGFVNINVANEKITGTNPLLSVSITCIASGGQSLAAVAVSGPSNAESAADMMQRQMISMLGGAAGHAAPSAPAVAQRTSSFLENTDLPGSDYRSFVLKGDARACMAQCIDDGVCQAWTFVAPRKHCFLKKAKPASRAHSGMFSGVITDSSGAPGQAQSTMEPRIDIPGRDYRHTRLDQARPEACRDLCLSEQRCNAWTYVQPSRGQKAHCWLKNNVSRRVKNNTTVSGEIKGR